MQRHSVFLLTFILFLVLFIGCENPKNNTAEASNIPIDQPISSENYIQELTETVALLNSITDRIHPSLPEYIFNIYGEEKERMFYFRKITITTADQPEKILQEIILSNKGSFDPPNAHNINCFYIEDMNFDGYKDFRLQIGIPPGPNIPYCYWIWDQNSSTFIQDNELEQITTPKVDYDTHTIISFVRESASTYSKRTYKYLNGHIKLVKLSTAMFTGETAVHITVRELRDNEMVVTTEYDKSEPIHLFDELE